MLGIRLPIENLQYHWNHPRGSSLKIQPFSTHSFLDKPDLTLKRFKLTSKFLLILAFLNQALGYSFIFRPKYEPPNTHSSNIFLEESSGVKNFINIFVYYFFLINFFIILIMNLIIFYTILHPHHLRSQIKECLNLYLN